MKNHYKKTHSNQDGFASIVVALILIIVLALTTIGFAKLARHEQESALDKQLSSQAYYAAESGINDAYKDITESTPKITVDGTEPGAIKADPDTCMPNGIGSAKTSNHTIDSGRDVSYSCLLVNLKPKSLKWRIQPNQARTQSFTSTSVLNNLDFYWSATDAGRMDHLRDAANKKFTPADDWDSPAVLQVTVVPIGTLSGGVVYPLIAENTQSFTAFFYPSSGGISTAEYTPNSSEQGPIVSGNCTVEHCKATITGLNQPAGTVYAINVLDYYAASDVTMCGNSCTTEFVNGQAEVDVTGKARNVLKRLKVRLSINQLDGNAPSRPNYALEAQNICKRLKVSQAVTTFDGGAQCQLDTVR